MSIFQIIPGLNGLMKDLLSGSIFFTIRGNWGLEFALFLFYIESVFSPGLVTLPYVNVPGDSHAETE